MCTSVTCRSYDQRHATESEDECTKVFARCSYAAPRHVVAVAQKQQRTKATMRRKPSQSPLKKNEKDDRYTQGIKEALQLNRLQLQPDDPAAEPLEFYAAWQR